MCYSAHLERTIIVQEIMIRALGVQSLQFSDKI